ncbi:MAG: YicC family protein [Verrucomicrobia bacterium]|nr:YicC family protein [Verrucomicrobiota bacterium]
MNSMTGFGHGEAVADGVVWRAELSSVNRKALELVVHLPRDVADLETPLRNRLAEKLSRGRVQCNITADRGSGASTTLRLDEPLAKQYAEHLHKLGFRKDISDPTRWPGVFTLEQTDISADQAQPYIEKSVDAALAQLLTMRRAEGENLKADISSRLDALSTMLQSARESSPQIVTRYRETLRQRLADAGLPLPLDDERLLKEIVIFADRSDISEEITRTESHIAQFRQYMDSGEPVGRALDFLCQELFREWNTTGSKANDAALAQTVVRAKTELEKIREQVQNIE